MKNYVEVIVTDFGAIPIKNEIVSAYEKSYQKLRKGKPTKKSLAMARERLSHDVSAMTRLCWVSGMNKIPKEFLG